MMFGQYSLLYNIRATSKALIILRIPHFWKSHAVAQMYITHSTIRETMQFIVQVQLYN